MRATCATTRPQCEKSKSNPFIVDVPATLLKRNTELSKAARVLYTTMRAMGNGKTGALKIRDRWLKATAIDAAAEMCRDVRLRAMRELVALGLVTMERERVERVIGGRKRVVLGKSRYYVHRPPVTTKNAQSEPFLLKSISTTVEKIDSQRSQKHLLVAVPQGAVGVSGTLQECEREQSSSPTPKTDDDFARALLANSEPESQPDKLTRSQAKAEETGRESAGKEWLAKTGKSQADLYRAFATILSRRRARSLSDPHAWWSAALDRYDERAVARPHLRNAINSGDPIKRNPAKTRVINMDEMINGIGDKHSQGKVE